jgi:hypothetical protein
MAVEAQVGSALMGVGVKKSSVVGKISETSLSSSDEISSSEADAEDGQGVEEFESREIERNIRTSFVLQISRRIICGFFSLLWDAGLILDETNWVTQRNEEDVVERKGEPVLEMIQGDSVIILDIFPPIQLKL